MKKLTSLKKAFCEAYLKNDYNATEAYMIASRECGNNAKRDTASAEGSHLLKDKAIIEEIDRLEGSYQLTALKSGLSKQKVIDLLKEMMQSKKKVFHNGNLIDESPDNTAINNAIVTYGKFIGAFVDKKKIEIGDEETEETDIEDMTDEQKVELKEKLLKEL
jgi:hypothetical protein